MGVDVQISCFSADIKLPAQSSSGIFEGENKWFDQGTVLLQRGEDGAQEILPFCSPVGSPGATEPTPWFPGVGTPFQRSFLLFWSLL